MSNTPIDNAKVSQMLDGGWKVTLEKGGIAGKSYIASAHHANVELWERARDRVLAQSIAAYKDHEHVMSEDDIREINGTDFDDPGIVSTEDFTPEQALTRLAYKVQGEII